MLKKSVSLNYHFEIKPELILGLEQYVAEYFKPICCNVWCEDIGDDALGIRNLGTSVNRIDDVLKSVDICTILNPYPANVENKVSS